MKKAIIAICLVLSSFAHAQQVWDDFTTGVIEPVTTAQASEVRVEHEAKNILGGKRVLVYNVTDNPYGQLFQLQLKNGLLISSTGYGTASSMSLSYGGSRQAALNMDLSGFKTINISFKGKTSFARVYLSMWSNGANRAIWRGNGTDSVPFHGSINDAGHHKEKVISIPLSQLTRVQEKDGGVSLFKIDDVDTIKFDFYGYPATGVNYAIDKIWVE